MNKQLGLVSIITPLLLVASCAQTPQLSLAEGTSLIVQEKNGVSAVTNLDLFNKLYASNGPVVATNELLYQIARDVFTKSGRTQADWEERIDDVFNSFLAPSYFNQQQFDEKIMAAVLLGQGYNIVCNVNVTPFLGTRADLPVYGNLRSALRCDYSDYINRKINRDIGIAILNEEFILSQRQNFFNSKQIREVKYFVFDPVGFTSAEQYANQYSSRFQTGQPIEDIVLGQLGLENEWRNLKFDDEARNFAVIDFTKSTLFSNSYINIFNTAELQASVRTELTTKINQYSNNGAHPITHGFELKNRQIKNTPYYFSKVGTNEGQTLVLSDLDARIFRVGSGLLLDSNGYLRVQSDSNVIANRGLDNKYYIIQVKVIDAASSLADKRKGAKALALNSANTRGAINYWLQQYKVDVFEEELYNHLNNLYGYTK
jgi:hypothetical protein